MDTTEFHRKIRELAPLDSLSSKHFELLVKKVRQIKGKKGERIFRRGESDKNHIYLLEGKIELTKGNQMIDIIKSGTEQAKHSIAHSQPRTLDARIITSEAVYIKIPSDMLDIMLTWDQTGEYHVDEVTLMEDEDDTDWMVNILQSKAFRRISPANLQSIFLRMEEVSYKAGDIVINQDQPGDYFYILKSGLCQATRKLPTRPGSIKLADLRPGDTFGEEALISDTPRNATLTMITDGSLMRLSKEDFLALMNEPMLNRISYKEGLKLAEQKPVIWLDVRLPNEHKQQHIPGSQNLPLVFLRMKMKQLDKNKTFILYCDTGGRSSAAAFLLGLEGFDTYVLTDGIASIKAGLLETTS